MYSEDMADACVHLMNLPDGKFISLLGSDELQTGRFEPPLVNIGVGEDISIGDLAATVGQIIGFKGDLIFDTSKPDGTPRKLMDVSRLKRMGWRARTPLNEGLAATYAEFASALVPS
jgi:GDP-L-fucose synthase